MTPPDWFLQLLGGIALAFLLFSVTVLLARFARLKRRSTRRQVRLTPEQHFRQAEDEQRSQVHARNVMRSGLLHAAFSRDSVALGDDATDHWRLLTFEQDLPISAVLGPPIHRVLASIQGGHATWLIQLHEPLVRPSPAQMGQVRVTDVAVVAQQWSGARLLVPDFSVSRVRAGTLHAMYLAQQDPVEVYEALGGRVESMVSVHPHFSRRAPAGLFEALRHLPNPRVQETYTSYAYTLEDIPAGKRVMIRLS